MISLNKFKQQIYSSPEYIINSPTAVALGNFDGLHLGHREVIYAAVEFAKRNGVQSLVHVLELSGGQGRPPLLTREKMLELLEIFGVDIVVLEEFNEQFKNNTCEEFVTEYIKNKLNAVFVSVGYNYTFGKGAAGAAGASGDAARLAELCGAYGIAVNITPPVEYGGQVVSSTKIRKLLADRDLQAARELLGHDTPFSSFRA